MSNWNPNIKFDYQNWCKQQVAKRARAALEARDAAFAEKHAETTLEELAQYLVRQANMLRHTPAPCEVDGGDFIEQRFGSWDAALKAAHLRPLLNTPKLVNTARYTKEKKIQEPLFAAECEEKKKQKRQKKAQCRNELAHERAEKRRAEKKAE